jgi:alpha-N-acetylglucosaminidase
MKKEIYLVITAAKCLLSLSLALAGMATMAWGDTAGDSRQAAAALLRRLLPDQVDRFIFEQIPKDQGQDVFEIESAGPRIVIRGNNGVAMAAGLNWYLKYYAHCHVSLNGRQVDLLQKLPPVEKKVRKTCWAASRYFLNYCTFSYSMSWWDWEQWEKFIDWMALNGINQPLAITGQEAVWQAVCKRFGMSDAEIESFLAGPPYLPFQWMGCLDGYGGPLPKDWIPRHVELQKKILARERELGMTPVLQGFTGHVPEAIVKRFPGTKARRIQWGEFNTLMLDPLDPLFQKLGTALIEEQTKLFGTDHLYDADSFIEMRPPSGDLKYLADTARAIYAGMAKADPRAVWLLQGWPFMYQREFWTPDRLRAFLDAIPNDRLLVLDLFCESQPTWKATQGFYGKPWVWSFVYNFGDTTLIGGSGPLARFNDLAAARKDPLGRNLRGVGLIMEGFSHNPLLYDIMFELAWRDDVELKSWVREFVRFRYGKANADAEAAWETLRTAVYDRAINGWSIPTSFPAIDIGHTPHPTESLAKALRLLLHAAPELERTETYRHDLVNVARQFLSKRANELYDETIAAYKKKDAAAFRKTSAAFLKSLHDLDDLLASNDEFLLGRWLESAKRWGTTDADRAKLQWNARRILTLWGNTTGLRDYACKEWSGLLSDFYAKRWELFLRRLGESLDSGKPFDEKACHAELFKYEDKWAGQNKSYPTKASGDCIDIVRRLLEKYQPQAANSRPNDKRGT